MDYKVGSLGDLISGGNTPGKKSVIEKEFKLKKKKAKCEQPENISNEENLSVKKKKKKNVIVEESKEEPEDKEMLDELPRKKKKKQTTKTVENELPQEGEDIPKRKKKKSKTSAPVEDAIDESVVTNGETSPAKKSKKRKHAEENDSTEETQGDAESTKVAKKEGPLHNAEKRIKAKKSKEKHDADKLDENKPLYNDRTIFVGNVPLKLKKKALRSVFKKYGEIETVRFRCAPIADSRTSKKVSIIKKEFHAERNTMNAFVRFAKREDALKAIAENGKQLQDTHIRVDICDTEEKHDEKKAIFVGNVCFDAEEEDLWKLFEPCGSIESVRLVRDRRTNVGKGFGYINFQSPDSVELALEMGEVKLKDRVLRIKASDTGSAKKEKKKNKIKIKRENQDKDNKENGPPSPKKMKKSEGGSGFQGSKFIEKKKKKKFDKGLIMKKKLIKKVAPRAAAAE